MSIRQKALAALAIAATTALGGALATGPAAAAPGDAFDPTIPQVFLSYGSGATTLAISETDGDGFTSYVTQGTGSLIYNATAFRAADNFLYGIADASAGGVTEYYLVKIGQNGVTTRVTSPPGSRFLRSVFGTFGPADGYYYVYASASMDNTLTPPAVVNKKLQRINVATGTVVSTIDVTGVDAAAGADFTYLGGYLWSANGSNIDRWDPATGVITRFPFNFETGNATELAGGAWTYGNGNLGFLFNGTSKVVQLEVTDPGLSSQQFRLVSTNSAVNTSNNDATAVPGDPINLSLAMTGPASVTPGTPFSYTLTVTNNGPVKASGFVVTDPLPAGLTAVSSPNAACTLRAGSMVCVGGTLTVGSTRTFTINATPTVRQVALNTATVLGNELDPVASNNAASVGIGSVSLTKTATVTDVNRNGTNDTGDRVSYSFAVVNDGSRALSGLRIVERGFSGSGTLSSINCGQTSLAVGASTNCTASYTVTSADLAAGSIVNRAVAEATPAGSSSALSSPESSVTLALSTPRSALAASGAEASPALAIAALLTLAGSLLLWRRRTA